MKDLRVGCLVEILGGFEHRVVDIFKVGSEKLIRVPSWEFGGQGKNWLLVEKHVKITNIVKVVEKVEGIEEEEDVDSALFHLERVDDPRLLEGGNPFMFGDLVRLEGLFNGASIEVVGYIARVSGEQIAVSERGQSAVGRYWVGQWVLARKILNKSELED